MYLLVLTHPFPTLRSSDLRNPRLRPGRVVQALHRQRAILAPPTLAQGALVRAGQRPEAAVLQRRILEREPQADDAQRVGVEEGGILVPADQIGRASCRERVCQYG